MRELAAFARNLPQILDDATRAQLEHGQRVTGIDEAKAIFSRIVNR